MHVYHCTNTVGLQRHDFKFHDCPLRNDHRMALPAAGSRNQLKVFGIQVGAFQQGWINSAAGVTFCLAGCQMTGAKRRPVSSEMSEETSLILTESVRFFASSFLVQLQWLFMPRMYLGLEIGPSAFQHQQYNTAAFQSVGVLDRIFFVFIHGASSRIE